MIRVICSTTVGSGTEGRDDQKPAGSVQEFMYPNNSDHGLHFIFQHSYKEVWNFQGRQRWPLLD